MKYSIFLLLSLFFISNASSQIKIPDENRETIMITDPVSEMIMWEDTLERVKDTNLYILTIRGLERELKINFRASTKEISDLYNFLKYRITQGEPAIITIGDSEYEFKGDGNRVMMKFARSNSPYLIAAFYERDLNKLFGVSKDSN